MQGAFHMMQGNERDRGRHVRWSKRSVHSVPWAALNSCANTTANWQRPLGWTGIPGAPLCRAADRSVVHVCVGR